MSELALPEGWVSTKLGNYVYLKNGYAFKSAEYLPQDNTNVPLIRIGDIQDNTVSTTNSVFVKANEQAESFVVNKGDLLIAMSGATTGKMGVYQESRKAYQNQRVGNIKFVSQNLGSELFRNYLIKSLKQTIYDIAYGGAQPNISAKAIENIEVALPSLNEQKVISQILSQYLTTVSQIQARLDAIPKLIEKFRQSILSDAVSGKLTEEWRKTNQTKSINLDDITRFWEEKYISDGKKYTLPRLDSLSKEVSLPPKWVYTQIGKVFDVYVGATPSRKESRYWGGDIPWVSSSEVAFCRIKDTKEKITKDGNENSSTRLHPVGTVMLAMIGQGKTRGQAAILDIAACHNQNTAALRVPEPFAISDYLYFYLLKMYQETRMVGSGNNQKALNKNRVQSLGFHLPPVNEQAEIVKQVNKLFAYADQIEKSVAIAKARVDNLTQSILHQAFTGQLTKEWREQNPALISGDNSAEALLAKIEAEKKASGKKGKAKK